MVPFLAFHVSLSVSMFMLYVHARLGFSFRCVVAVQGFREGAENCDSEAWLVASCHLVTSQLSEVCG